MRKAECDKERLSSGKSEAEWLICDQKIRELKVLSRYMLRTEFWGNGTGTTWYLVSKCIEEVMLLINS